MHLPESLPEDAARTASEGQLRSCLRDVMSLLALPALLSGRQPTELLELLAGSVERVLPVDVCHVRAPLGEGEPPVEVLRVEGQVGAPAAPGWNDFTMPDDAGFMPGTRAGWLDTPIGRRRVVRLIISYAGQAGVITLGSSDPAFPDAVAAVVLRAVASLAGSALSTAAAMHEREEALRVKDEFLAMLGHELRNPLAPIATVVSILKIRGGGKLSGELQIVERQVSHLTALVDDLLDVARVTRGKVELNQENTELAVVIARAVEMCRPLIERQRHVFDVRVPLAGLPVHVDPRRMAQVISNLLVNAAKYTPEGGRIELWAEADGGNAIVGVRDNGLGIPGEVLPHLFEMFYQVRSEPGQSGLGIGLALVKSLVTLHGGTVSAHSAGPGCGSQFVVNLPLASPASAALAKRPFDQEDLPLLSAGPAQRHRVLVVDDNRDAASMLAQLLDIAGHETAVAHDAASALQLCDGFRPTVAVLDIGLPGVDGYQLARMMHDRMRATTPRLLALTGYGLTWDAQRSADARIELHLVKPVDPARLLIAINGETKESERPLAPTA